MKIINHICDRCGAVIGTQMARAYDILAVYLQPLGKHEEVCDDCIKKILYPKKEE